MITMDDRNIRKFELELKLFAKRAYPFATKDTLNNTAKAATSFTRLNMRDELTLRNRFTENSMRTTFVRGLNVDRQQAVTGSISEYMPIVEFGGVKGAEGSTGVPLPTSFAAGQGDSKDRTKLPRGKKKLSRIKLAKTKGRKPKTRKQAVLRAVQEAVTTGKRDVFLDLGKKQGIFRVRGGRKGFKRGWPKGARLRMLYDLSSKTRTIPAHPVMGPAVKEAAKILPTFYLIALKKQLRRQGLFL